MKNARGLFALENQYQRLSDLGDQLEVLNQVVDFELFRPRLVMALKRSDRGRGGRPPYDAVMMFKILIIQTMNDLSDERVEYLINDRLSFMRFLGIEIGAPVPDAKTIWLYRQQLSEADTLKGLLDDFNEQLKGQGYLAMGGQIVDATIAPAPKQRLTEDEKAQIKEGKSAEEIWDNPHVARHKDTDAKWSIKFSKAKTRADGTKPQGHVDIAIPSFGYKNHISTDRRFGFIRGYEATGASAHDGAQLENVLADNTASSVWADSAYRSAKNERMLDKKGLVSKIHRKKPKGKPMPQHVRKGNATKSKIRSKVEHVFGDQKNRIGLVVRCIGIARAKTRIGLVNLAYNMRRLIYWQGKTAG